MLPVDTMNPIRKIRMISLLQRALPALPVLLLPLALGACDVFGPGENTLLLDQLRFNESKWAAEGTADYTITVSRGGTFDDMPRPIATEVVNNAIVSANYADDGTPVEPSVLAEQQTVTDLFAFLHNALNQKPVNFSVNYDDDFGYPNLIILDFDARRLDDDVTIVVNEFVPAGATEE
jgi:hypothetical protein